MNNWIKNIFIAVCSLTLLWCKFLPLTLTIMSILIITMVITSNEIINDKEGKNVKLKYFFAILIYIFIFLLIYFYMKFNNLDMGEFTIF